MKSVTLKGTIMALTVARVARQGEGPATGGQRTSPSGPAGSMRGLSSASHAPSTIRAEAGAMNRPTRVLILLAFIVPVAAYVAGSLSGSPAPPPTDRGPVILRDVGTTTTPEPTTPAPPTAPSPGRPTEPSRAPSQRPGPGDDHEEARVVTPQPTPVGEDDDEWDDDGPDDDDTSDDGRGERGDD
jgi:hypothetical protein